MRYFESIDYLIERLRDEPLDLQLVQDKEGDIWHRLSDGTWSCSPYVRLDGQSFAYLLQAYGPLQEVAYDPDGSDWR